MTTRTRRDFKHVVRQAVRNPRLARAMGRATKKWAQHGEQAFAGIDFGALRDEVKAIKTAAIADLPQLIETFKSEAEGVGAQVYRAADAQEANGLVRGILAARGVRKVVKSKSMLTEEIGLNAELIAAGMQVTETDLGEWIVQLAGDRPSHFVGPAVHFSREEVAELFSRVVGQPVPVDIETLVGIARGELRQAFIEADAGISGANIAIAESGSLVIVTNEGNGRLVTTLPPVHVAVVGIEKIVPDLMAAATILRILPRSATGQKLTSYVSFITGPSRTGDIEQTLIRGVHGPKELHIVLVDNGRSQMRDDPEFREALHCIKCARCLNVCPIFGIVGGHVFGHVYQGGIGAVLTAFQAGLQNAVDPLRLCTTCQRCVPLCPAGIDIPRMVVALRRRVVQQNGLGRLERLGYRRVLSDQRHMDRAARVARVAQALLGGRGEMVRSLPLFLSPLTEHRSLPKLARQPLSRRWKEIRTPGATITVAFYPGCLIEYAYPEIGEAVASVLRARGLEVKLPPARSCCGFPALNAGDEQAARQTAVNALQSLEEARADYVVTACPTCSLALRKELPRLFADDARWAPVAEKIAAQSFDFSEFLVRVLKEPVGALRPNAQRAAYHDPCHLRHGLGISAEPRQLIRNSGYVLTELEGADACCGCAGLFAVKFPEISSVMLQRKAEAVELAEVDVVATDCPACIMQIRGGLDKRGSTVKVVHTAQIVAEQDVLVANAARIESIAGAE